MVGDRVAKPVPADADVEAGVWKEPAPPATNAVHDWDCSEAVRLDLGKAAHHALEPHPRIDEHRCRAGAEQAERERDELDARANHQHDAMPWMNAHRDKPDRDPIRLAIEFGEGDAAFVAT